MRKGETEAEWRSRHYAIKVHILDTDTGQTCIRSDVGWDEDDQPGQFSDFMWSEGNYACDCNRGDFFDVGAGRPTQDYPCNGHRFKIEKIVRVSDGAVVYAE